MRRGALVTTVLAVVTVLMGVPAATAGPDTTPPPPRPDYRGTVSMEICSGSIVRFAGSRDTDRALALTNGHCHGKKLLEPDVVLGEQPARRPVALLDRRGEKVGSVLTDRLLFATMRSTDVALYRLRVTYRGLRERFGVRPLELATRRAAPSTRITIPAGLNRIEYRCGSRATTGGGGRCATAPGRAAPSAGRRVLRCSTAGGGWSASTTPAPSRATTAASSVLRAR